jgi:predicted metalloprotease with PDZ domain
MGQANRDDLTPLEIHYTTTVADDLGSLQIGLDVEHVSRPRVHLAMPAWTPGAYGVGTYANRVQDLVVTGADGAVLTAERIDPSTWSVATAGSDELHVRYTVPMRRGRGGGGDAEITGVRFSGPNTYMYVRGAKHLPVSSRYVVPNSWGVANGLRQDVDPMQRYARDYDTFIDAPTIVGRYRQVDFEVDGTPFHCVFFENAQEYDFNMMAFVDLCERIVVNQGQLYGSFPFPDYWFLFTLPGGGGLEHLNSTSIGLRAESQKADPRAGASVTSHEFFHVWNVKRIRPKVLGPFEYEHENYTGNLWVSEGWTSYFGDLTLARTGIWSREEYLNHLGGVISRELSKPRREEHSVFWASRNVWHRFPNEEGSRVDYYGTGEMLGAALDLTMRHETGGRKNLNDVMRFMNRWFAESGIGFEEGDIERACVAVSNLELREWFARHVYGTVDPDFKTAFGYAGIDYAEEITLASFPFPMRGARIFAPGDENDASQPRRGDVLVEFGGAEFTGARAALAGHSAGDEVVIVFERDGERHESSVTLTEARRVHATLSFRDDATAEQLAIREAWLTSVD